MTKKTLTPEERKAAEAAKHAPVSLPSGGSFEVSDLHKNLEKVVDREPDNRDAEVRAALERSESDAARTEAGSDLIPGHRLVETEVELAPGTEVGTGKDKETVGQVKVKERIQVLDPDAETVDAGQAVVGGPSKVLSSKPIGEAAEVAAPSPAAPATDA